jgi:hypothetical protein
MINAIGMGVAEAVAVGNRASIVCVPDIGSEAGERPYEQLLTPTNRTIPIQAKMYFVIAFLVFIVMIIPSPKRFYQ